MKNKIANKMSTFIAKHRAECANGDFIGAWRDNVLKAYDDAKNHRLKKGKENHIIHIVTEQKVRIQYE